MNKPDLFTIAGPIAPLLFAIAVVGFSIVILLADDQPGLQLLAAAALIGALLQGRREIRWLYHGNKPWQKVVHYDHFRTITNQAADRILVSCYRQSKPEQTTSCLSRVTCNFCRQIGAQQVSDDLTQQRAGIPPPHRQS